MTAMVILTEAELRAIIKLDEKAVATIEDAFAALATKDVVMPPILRLDIVENNGEVDVKTAYIPGVDSFAIKVSPGFFDNPKIGLPSLNGMMMLLSSRTGLVQAVLLDNGYLTDIRTAAAGAVAAKHLARRDARIATIFGAGTQAQLQLKALSLVRPIKEARIWARDHNKAQELASALSDELSLPVHAIADPAIAVAGSDIIVTTTPATRPVLQAHWLEAGQHITAMGSDAEHKNEIDPAVFNKASLYIADSLKQTRILGELHHAIASGAVLDTENNHSRFTELGAIIAGKVSGRTSANDITFADLTGTGVQDTAIATLAFAIAKQAGMGTQFYA